MAVIERPSVVCHCTRSSFLEHLLLRDSTVHSCTFFWSSHVCIYCVLIYLTRRTHGREREREEGARETSVTREKAKQCIPTVCEQSSIHIHRTFWNNHGTKHCIPSVFPVYSQGFPTVRKHSKLFVLLLPIHHEVRGNGTIALTRMRTRSRLGSSVTLAIR